MTDSDDKIALEPVIDNLPHPIMVVNQDRVILVANKMFAAFAQKSKKDIYGIRGGNAFSCVHSQDSSEGCGFGKSCQFCSIKKTVEATFRTRQNQPMTETVMTFRDKGKRWMRFCTTHLPLADTELVIVSVEDITDLKKQEQLRVINEKLRAAIETGGAVCHELNQPLQVLSAEIDLMTERSVPDSSEHERLIEMKMQVKRMSDIMKKLMNLHSYHTTTYIDEIKILDLDKSSKNHS